MTRQDSTVFLRDYIDLISGMGKSIGNMVWWACIISSKNRFYTRFTERLRGNCSTSPSIVEWIFNLMGLIKHIGALTLRLTISALFRRFYINKVISRVKGRQVTIIKTFGFATTSYSDFRDPYFGNVPNLLKENNESTISIYEPIGSFWKCIKEVDLSYSTLSYFDLLRISDIFHVLTSLVHSFLREFRTKRKFRFADRDISSDFRSLYLFEHFSPATFHAMTFYYLTKNLCRTFNVKKFIYTYENNSWERMCILGLREFSPRTSVIAYQHNVIPLASANMFYGKGETDHSPVPDKILTTGPRPLVILETYGHFDNVPIYSSAAIRYQYLENIKPSILRRDAPKLLVALEGVWQAAEIMNHLFSRANEFDGWQVIVRTHPALDYVRLQKKIRYRISDFLNFSLSKEQSLPNDIIPVTAVLYWGSTVALESIKFGKPLINIKLSHELDFDPLFELSALKYEWSPTEPIKPILQGILELEETQYMALSLEANDYLANYFHPVTRDNLKEFFA